MTKRRRKWVSPVKGTQLFIPQQYVAACAPDETYIEYKFECNAGVGIYYVWEETNGTSGLQTGIGGDRYINRYQPCEKNHSVIVRNGESVDDIFPYGYISKNRNGVPYINVRIWTENGTNLHCTENLAMNEWIEKNPS